MAELHLEVNEEDIIECTSAIEKNQQNPVTHDKTSYNVNIGNLVAEHNLLVKRAVNEQLKIILKNISIEHKIDYKVLEKYLIPEKAEPHKKH